MTNPTITSPPQPPVRRRRWPRVIKRLILGAFLLFALVVGALLGRTYVSSPAVRETVAAALTGKLTPHGAFPGRTEVNVLLLGRDLDRDNHGNVLKTNGRTDTIIMAHYDFRNRTVNMLSIPRDTLVRVPGHGLRKINSAHASGGPDLACRTVERFLRVRPDYYIVVDFEGFEKAVDQIGGLDLTVDKQMDYDDNWGHLHIHLKPGPQHLNGEQAIGFVRYRMSNTGVGDTDMERIARQQQFLRAVKRQVMRPSTLLRLPRALEAVSPHVRSSLTFTQMLALARFAREVPPESIRAETIPTSMGRRYVKADTDAMQKLVQEMFN